MLFLEIAYLSSSFVRDGLIVMDFNVGFFNLNVSFSLFTSSYNYKTDVNIWHARLGHISQSRIQRVAEEALLAHIEQVILPIFEHPNREINKKTTWKGYLCRTSIVVDSIGHLWSNERANKA